MVRVKWFFREMKESFKRVSKKDPITFWCSITGVITGTLSIILHMLR